MTNQKEVYTLPESSVEGLFNIEARFLDNGIVFSMIGTEVKAAIAVTINELEFLLDKYYEQNPSKTEE